MDERLRLVEDGAQRDRVLGHVPTASSSAGRLRLRAPWRKARRFATVSRNAVGVSELEGPRLGAARHPSGDVVSGVSVRGRRSRLRLRGVSRAPAREYRRDVSGGSFPEWSQAEQVRVLIPVFAVGAAVIAAVADPSSGADLVLCGLAAAPFFVWAYVPGVPLPALSLAVIVPAVVAQRSGQLEPLLFEVSLLAFVIGGSASSTAASVALCLVAALAPVAAAVVQDPSEISVGIWILSIAFLWVFGRTARRQGELVTQLQATRRELAQQAVLVERRRIARDVHDFVGHGLAAVMLQVTSARHVLRRDAAAAEEALRSAEVVGRRSMRELRRTVALLRSDSEGAVAPPIPSASEIPALVEDARTGGLAVELRMRGDHSGIAPGVGVALYRIAQEALANAARHAPRARTVFGLDVGDGRARLTAETTGPTAAPAGEPERACYGLIGMRERAAALGGELTAGPTPDGWLVTCTLPLEATDAPPVSDGAAQ
jgi:signal transduction histidine kinase